MKSNSRPFTGETLTKITISLISITAISGTICSSVYVNADDVTEVIDNVNLTVPVSCTYSGGGTYNETMAGGTTKEITANAITTSCNDYNGYAIYAIGFSNGKYTSDTTGSNTDMITSLGSSYNITNSSNNTYGSNWKMKLTSPTDATIEAGYSNYTAIPSTYTKVASYIFNTTGASITPKYQITTGSSQPAGTYTGKVKYTLVHPNTEIPLHPEITTAGQICYYPNGSNVVGTMGCQDVASSIDLLASNFSRSGYGFAGWNTEFDYSGTFYGPNETISLNTADYSGTNPGLSLYAIWVKGVGSLQDSSKVTQLCGTGGTGGSLRTAPIDGTANLSSVSALTDQRDNQTYAIAKLADGKCWMIENLRLDNTAELTTTNTNNPLNDGTNVTLKHNYTDTDTHNTLSPTSAVAYNADAAPDGWCTTHSAACDDQSRLRTDNTANRATGNPNVNTGSMYSYGNYYNWYSATAGNGTYSKSSGETAGDLCPSGWKLPYGNSTGNGNTSGGFYYLNYKINNDTNATDSNASKNLRAYPNNYLYSGYVSGGSLSYRGSYGNYWSSTAYSSNYAYFLNLNSSFVDPGTYGSNKYYGGAVRCLASS